MQVIACTIITLCVLTLLATISNNGMNGYLVHTLKGIDRCGALECAESISVLSYVESGLNEAYPGSGTCIDNCMRFFCRGSYAVGASNCTIGTGLVESTCPSLNLCVEECAIGCTGGSVASGECITTDIVNTVCPS